MNRVDNFDQKNKKGEPTILCSICIATFRREKLLEKLIISLINQKLPRNVELEIIIVDNDKNRSAEKIVKNFKSEAKINFHYLSQSIRNISLTRNLGVKHAKGIYILFIDDDEVASDRWVYYLLNTINDYSADGVFGKVIAEFNAHTPRWMMRNELFFHNIQPTGQLAKHKYTTNCIIKASLLKKMEEPFDPAYGLTGGEDSDLFHRLEKGGARFVCSQEAVSYEYLPSERTRLSYLFLRKMRYAIGPTRQSIEAAGRKRIFIQIFMIGKALCYGTVSIILAIIFLPFPERRAEWLLKLGSNVGRFLTVFGWDIEWYR
jgi:succinoglycan biosynthesis protein ExoM